jgi:hypothetical protein
VRAAGDLCDEQASRKTTKGRSIIFRILGFRINFPPGILLFAHAFVKGAHTNSTPARKEGSGTMVANIVTEEAVLFL